MSGCKIITTVSFLLCTYLEVKDFKEDFYYISRLACLLTSHWLTTQRKNTKTCVKCIHKICRLIYSQKLYILQKSCIYINVHDTFYYYSHSHSLHTRALFSQQIHTTLKTTCPSHTASFRNHRHIFTILTPTPYTF